MSVETLKKPRKFIVCCDGTWLNSDEGWKAPSIIPWDPTGHLAPPSNVTRLARCLKPIDSDGNPQVVFYQAGIGTGWTLESQIFGGALGLGLSQNIREAYEFVASNYTEGDEIYLVGFSRGAFTARSVGGLIASIGLLTKRAMAQFPYVFNDWENTTVKGYKISANGGIRGFDLKAEATDADYQDKYMAELKRLGMTREVRIKAIGVWDTVGALGIPITPWLQYLGFPTSIHSFKFYDTALDNHVEHAFQALALDERRSTYIPCIWNKQPGSTTNLIQCWFSGVHSNIGGSYPHGGLGAITLAWMMSKLAPFLEFEENSIKDMWEDEQRFLNQKVEKRYKGWGMGEIVNSARFPRSLLGIHTRTPGQYHTTNLQTGRPILSEPKLQTHEHVHASVRERVVAKGAAVDGKKGGYHPKALEQWRMEPAEGKDVQFGRGSWVFVGPKREAQLERLPEDELGGFERELLELEGMAD